MDEIDDSDLDAFIPKEVVQDEGDKEVAEEEEEDTDEEEEESGDSEDEEVDENNSEEIEVKEEGEDDMTRVGLLPPTSYLLPPTNYWTIQARARTLEGLMIKKDIKKQTKEETIDDDEEDDEEKELELQCLDKDLISVKTQRVPLRKQKAWRQPRFQPDILLFSSLNKMLRSQDMPKKKATKVKEMTKTTKKATTNKQRNNKNDYTVESLMEQILNNKNTTKKQTNNKKDEQQIANIMEQILFSL